ncbi:uncharacterized protein SCHCODRAFT_02187853 [Schizophyllum commune H4-8]|uniref:Expressed protein n=1 Tax=Schizophyllum commune (strain H4-8 / FGSC 9210) TaxID=578458 RepID=D8PZA3_SCHCM|nr:uncharacterized protein SCHCODRAFT_02187853 [Schizophyllum commune H4-8]KAI5896285.1 hypothetical protein SCHCODRAFT_02187853 [Schizophyllum commune H4-8]
MSAGATESSSSTKRRRVDAEDECDEPIVRSRVWFKDGNIVLQAQRVQFRFYQGLLATYSPFFRDVFEVPQPADGADAVEGCPVMRLQESAADVEYMLNFILEPKSSKQTPSVANVIAGLQMGQKYLIAALWDDAVERLRYEFPDRLEVYQERREGREKPGYTRFCVEPGRTFWLAHLLDTARSVGLQTIMPALCFRVSEGSSIENLTQGLLDDITSDVMSMHTRNVLLGGRIKTLAAQVKLIRVAFSEPQPPSQECTDRNACREARRRMFDYLLETLEKERSYALFCPWSERLQVSPNLKCCVACAETILRTVKEERQVIWDSLPSFFGLPSWGELKDFSIAEGD